MICIFKFADPISVPTKQCLYVKERSIYKDCFVGTLIGSAFSNLQILEGLLCGDTYWICIFKLADPVSVPTKRCLYVKERSIYKDCFVGTLNGSAFSNLQIQ